jgi:hypothetical protein
VAGTSETPRGRTGVSLSRRTLALLGTVLFVLTAATYGVSSWLQETWQRDRGLDRVLAAGLVTDLDLVQTVGDVRVRLQRAYADANRIALGVTVDAPSLRGRVTVDPRSVELRDDAGTLLEPEAGHGYGDAATPFGASVLTFDAAPLEGRAGQHAFVFTIQRIAGSDGSASGPWVFRFSLDVHAGHVAVVDTTISGVFVHARVIATVGETRVVVDAHDTGGRAFAVRGARLIRDGTPYAAGRGRCLADGTCPLFVFSEPAFDAARSWGLALEGIAPADGTPASEHVDGVWVLPLEFRPG